MASKTPEEKLAELQAAKEKIQARISKERQKLRKKNRRDETRQKIIIGSIMLAHAEKDPEFEQYLWTILKNRVIRDKDRELLGLKPLDKQ